MHLLPRLARNLKALRAQRDLSLSALSRRCGIAKSTLSQLEHAQRNPTVDTLWAIAAALEVPFGSLIADGVSPVPGETLNERGASVRLIERTEGPPRIEVYLIELAPGHRRTSSPHPAGVKERVVVLQGDMLLGSATSPQRRQAGESHAYAADVPHVYDSAGQSAKAMVFIEYPPDVHPATPPQELP